MRKNFPDGNVPVSMKEEWERRVVEKTKADVEWDRIQMEGWEQYQAQLGGWKPPPAGVKGVSRTPSKGERHAILKGLRRRLQALRQNPELAGEYAKDAEMIEELIAVREAEAAAAAKEGTAGGEGPEPGDEASDNRAIVRDAPSVGQNRGQTGASPAFAFAPAAAAADSLRASTISPPALSKKANNAASFAANKQRVSAQPWSSRLSAGDFVGALAGGVDVARQLARTFGSSGVF